MSEVQKAFSFSISQFLGPPETSDRLVPLDVLSDSQAPSENCSGRDRNLQEFPEEQFSLQKI